MTIRPIIAVVDDDEAIRAGLSSLIRSEGYDIALFDSAEAFLEGLRSREMGCLLTDIQMPGMSGLDLLALLRSERPALPVLIMTAFPAKEVRDRAFAAGAMCVLSKPFDAGELLQYLRRALSA